MSIVCYQDKSRQYRWRLVARNGRIVADSAESYVSKHNLERAVTSVMLGVAGPVKVKVAWKEKK